MLNVTVNNRFGLHQRIMLMIMLVLLQFYSIGSDFFPENITAHPINQGENSLIL